MNTDTPTPRTDELYRDHMSDPYQDTGDLAAIMHIQCERFERELTAVTEQRDRLAEALRVIIIEEESRYREHAFNATVAREALAAVEGGADELQR